MAYIIAPIAGRKGYRSTTLPGPITITRGLEQLDTLYEGYTLRVRNRGMYKESPPDREELEGR